MTAAVPIATQLRKVIFPIVQREIPGIRSPIQGRIATKVANGMAAQLKSQREELLRLKQENHALRAALALERRSTRKPAKAALARALGAIHKAQEALDGPYEKKTGI